MKDNFSSVAAGYAKFRPTYPAELFEELASLVNERKYALDCGTGNGQFAVALAGYFEKVYATDISSNQIESATQHANVIYSVQSAEQTNFDDHYFDMISIAQAIHWFDFPKFYAEVNRILKHGGIIAAISYGLLEINKDIDAVINHFYVDITGPYWDPERKYIDEAYQTIPFPFKEIPLQSYVTEVEWTCDHLIGFLNTWSAVSHYKKAKGENPVDQIEAQLRELWMDGIRQVRFPIITRIGRL